MARNKKTNTPSEEEILNLIEAFKYFDKTTTALNQAYRRLELKIDDLRSELEEKNRLLSGSVLEATRAKTYLSLILENMSSGVAVVDKKGAITHFNKVAGEITGFSPDDALGKSCQLLLDDPEKPELSLLTTLKTEKPINKKEKILLCKSGDKKPVLFSTSIILDEKEELLGAVEIFEDLTELKTLQEEVRRHQTLVELGEMAASIAHEIRNPLGGIGGFATLLERDLAGDEAKLKLLRRIIKGINELHKLTSDVLIYTRKMEPNIVSVNLKNALQEAISLIKMEAEEANVKIEYLYPKENIEVEIDIDLLKRMMLNLMKNAVHAMPQGGKLTIDLSWQLLHNRFKVTVKDDGLGIEKDNLDKIFNPFFTTSSKGTGLGLAMVRRMVEAHKGSISVKSEIGQGTEFNITLPILQK